MSKKLEPTTCSGRTLFAEGSPAKTSAPQDAERALKESDQDSGGSMRESFARWCPDSLSWKTSQRSLFGGLTLYSDRWPRSGTMLCGTVYRLNPSAPITGGIACSLSPGQFPTPTSARYGTGQNGKRGNGTTFKGKGSPSLDTMATQGRWPTPLARDYKDTGRPEVLAKYAHKKRLACSVAASNPHQRGSLNPTWVEWLMGFPIGWTD